MSHSRSLNRVILVGRVGQDPEITHIPSLNKDVAKFSIATNEVYMDKNQQWQETTEWHRIVAWEWNAKKAERDLRKGTQVLIEGRLKTRKWQDRDGQQRSTTEIQADSLIPLEKAGDRGSSPYGAGQDQESQSPNDRYFQQSGPQAPPEVQIDDMPYDESSDPF